MADPGRANQAFPGVRLSPAGSSIQLQRMDVRQLEFKDASFDSAMICFALHDMPRKVRKQALAEARRVARDELIIVDYNFPRRPLFGAPLVSFVNTFETAYFKSFAAEGVLPLLSELGLHEVTMKTVGPTFAIWKVRLERGS